MIQLTKRRAVVTGSSSGIGREIALQLARCGADVLVHAKASREAADEVATEIASLGRQSQVALFDLDDVSQQDRLTEFAWEWGAKIAADGESEAGAANVNVWINNAGADVLTGAAADWPFEKKLETLWRVDVVAAMRLSRAVGQRMKSAGGGVLLNMGWDQADHGMAGDSGEMFAATKGAVMAFTRSLAKSLAPKVRVNCLAPGWIKTAWGEQASSGWQERAKMESLLDRWGTPKDVARAAAFLVSSDAEFINGQIVPINGGLK